MSTATGEYAFDFSVQSNQNPFSNANFTAGLGAAQISSGLLQPNSSCLYLYTGGTYDGGPVESSVEINATAATDDEALVAVLDENGDGYALEVRPAGVVILVYTAYAVVDSAGTGTITFTANDLFNFKVTKGTPNTYIAKQNGSTITLSQTTDTKTLSNLRAGFGLNDNNVGSGRIKSFAVVDGLSVGSTGTLAATESGADTLAATGGVGSTGIRLTLRDTDTGAVAASLTGLIVSVRSTSQATSLLFASVTNETTDGSGVLEVSSASIGSIGDYVYVTVEKSDHSIVATYRVQVIDLNA